MSNSFSVSKVTDYIKGLLEDDPVLRKVSVKGEVSNCKYHSSGHIYFTLKDEGATLKAVMFSRERASGLDFRMEEGDKVIVTGRISVYNATGAYQLYAATIKKDGEGDLYAKFLALKKELEEMGMFDESYKQPIPGLIKRLGVVTASTGAAVRDIISVTRKRNPYVEVILYPAQVQGEGAVPSIVKGIETLDKYGDVDVIIVGRGGGSIEDLWAFNEEAVARAIFDCRTPVISAVGHETDTTIADFVADKRAATPSQAAEFAVAEYSVINGQIKYFEDKITTLMLHRISDLRGRCKVLEARIASLSPENKLLEKKHTLALLSERMDNRMEGLLHDRRKRLEILSTRLDGLSPLKKLSGGYSYVSDASGRGVTHIGDISVGDSLTVNVTDGAIETQVTGVSPVNREE